MLSGSEQARMLEFEAEILATLDNDCHHEEALANQETFKKQTVSLINKIKALGNPFCDVGPELVPLDCHDVLQEEVVQTVCNIENIGKHQYYSCRQALLVHGTNSIHDPIKRNALRLT